MQPRKSTKQFESEVRRLLKAALDDARAHPEKVRAYQGQSLEQKASNYFLAVRSCLANSTGVDDGYTSNNRQKLLVFDSLVDRFIADLVVDLTSRPSNTPGAADLAASSFARWKKNDEARKLAAAMESMAKEK